MSKATTESQSAETESENGLSRQSGSSVVSSIRSENLSVLTNEQQQLVSAYWPLARKAAAETKKRIKHQRKLSTEETDFIDDYMTDSLFKLVKKLDTDCPHRISSFLLVSFQQLVKWYRSPTKPVTIDCLEDVEESKLEAKQEWFDVVEYTGCPYPETVTKILAGESLKDIMTSSEQRQWLRTKKKVIQPYLKELYES